MSGIKVISTGSSIPTKVITNEDFEKIVETSDEWIVERTGIHHRHFVENQTVVDLGYLAAKEAIEKSNINKEDIGLIVVATISSDFFTPSTACLIQERLGLNDQEIMAFDISAACSGFVYGLTIVNALLKTMEKKYALVIGSEVLSKLLDFKDRNTCILFGDGAGALLVENSSNMFISYNNSMGNENALYAATKDNQYMHMDGKGVFKFAVTAIPESINKVLERANMTLDDIDYVVCHQANYRIIKNAYKKLKCNPDKFYMNLQEYGNTSGASIPIALAEMDGKGLLKAGMKVICVGFGGGLTWGATLIEW